MTGSKGSDDKPGQKRVRKPLPKIKKLNNTSAMSEKEGGAIAFPSETCPTPQQPGYTQNTHLPYC